jgi:hypothetical protein
MCSHRLRHKYERKLTKITEITFIVSLVLIFTHMYNVFSSGTQCHNVTGNTYTSISQATVC